MKKKTVKVFVLSFVALAVAVSIAFALGGSKMRERASSLTASIGRLFTKTVDFNTKNNEQAPSPSGTVGKNIGGGDSVSGVGQSGAVGAINSVNIGSVDTRAGLVPASGDKSFNSQVPKTEAEIEKLKKELEQKTLAEKQIRQESAVQQELIQKTAEQLYQEKLRVQLEQQKLSEEQRKQQEAQMQRNLKTAVDQLKSFFIQKLSDYNAQLNALDNQLANKESEINLLNQEYNKKIEGVRSQTIPMLTIIEQENQLIQEKNDRLSPLQSELKSLRDQRDKLKSVLIISDPYIYSINNVEYKFTPSVNGDGGYLADPNGNYYRVIYYPSGSFVVSLPR